MRKDNRFYLAGLLGVCAAIIMLAGCATYNADKAYLAALEQYNAEVKRYEAYYQAATPEDQAVYKAEIDPLILKANDALELWGAARTLGHGDGMEMEHYLDAKNAKIDALAKAYAKEE